MKLKITIFCILFLLCWNQRSFCQIITDSLDSFQKSISLTKGSKTKYLSDYPNVTIYYNEYKNDTLLKNCYVEVSRYIDIKNDSLVVTPLNSDEYLYRSKDMYDIHINYNFNTKIKINIATKDIKKIKISREGLKTFTGVTMALSGLSALIVAPAISLGKNFNQRLYYPVAGCSLGVFTTALIINTSFGSKIFHLKHSKKKNWTIDKDTHPW